MSPQIYKKYNWQCASVVLAMCTARVEGHRVGSRALLHAIHHCALRAKIIIADFNLAVSTLTAKYSIELLHVILLPLRIITFENNNKKHIGVSKSA